MSPSRRNAMGSLPQWFGGWSSRRTLQGAVAVVVAAAMLVGVVLGLSSSGPRNGGGGQVGVAGGGAETTTTTSLDSSSTSSTSSSTSVSSTTTTVNPTKGSSTSTKVSPAGAGTPSSGTAAGSSSSAGQRCVSPPGTDQGVTASQITIAVLVSTSGAEPASTEQAAYQAVIDSMNAAGGAACHQVVPRYFQVNPTDSASLQQTCQAVIKAHVFDVIAPGIYDSNPSQASCLSGAGVPVMAGLVTQAQQAQSYPYLFGQGSWEEIYRNAVFGFAQRGAFKSNGFTKLGLLYRDCMAQLPGEVEGWLHQAGVTAAQIVTYDVGCPTGKATPSNIGAAHAAFASQNVTNVMLVDDSQDLTDFTAGASGYRYDLVDDGLLAQGTTGANSLGSGADGALAVTPNRYGEQDTTGTTPSAATAKCNAIMAAHGQPAVYKQPEGAGGTYCDAMWMFQAAVGNSPQIGRSTLAAGLQASKAVDFSYPLGPNDFTAPHTTYGDQYWRVDQYHASCSCWQVLDPTFHPAFP